MSAEHNPDALTTGPRGQMGLVGVFLLYNMSIGLFISNVCLYIEILEGMHQIHLFEI